MLETQLAELNTNIKALIAVMGGARIDALPPTKPKAEPAKPQSEQAAATKVITYDEVKTITHKLINEKGRDAAIAVLAPFNAKKTTQLEAAQYPDFVAAVKKALAAPAPAAEAESLT